MQKKKKKKNEIRPLTYTTHKNYLKMDQWFNIRPKIITFLKEAPIFVFFFFGYDTKITTKEKEIN